MEPPVYVCENNGYAISLSKNRAMRVEHISDRAMAYGIPGITVDGMDVLAVYEAVQAAVERARSGQGPSIVECVTGRWRGHNEGVEEVYRCL